jgi:hypothetical protein
MAPEAVSPQDNATKNEIKICMKVSVRRNNEKVFRYLVFLKLSGRSADLMDEPSLNYSDRAKPNYS